jgi:hypothetical protein
MGQSAISCTDRRQASLEARLHLLTVVINLILNCIRLACALLTHQYMQSLSVYYFKALNVTYPVYTDAFFVV